MAMKGFFAFSAGLLLAASSLSGTSRAQRQKSPASPQKAEAPGALKPLELLQGDLKLKTKEGKTTPIHVVVRQWDMLRGEHVEKFAEPGFTLVQLRGGQVKTIIGGKEQQRRHDEFWVLPAGTQMTVVVTSEEAVLQTIAVKTR